MMKSLRTLICCAALILAFRTAAPAQESRATLRGTVTDAQGNVVVNAAVAIRNEGTGEAISAPTNEKGLFLAPYLKPGRYAVSVEYPGFKKLERSGMQLDVGQVAEVSLQLEIGDLTQTITVSTEAPLLDNVTADRGQVIGRKLALDLPLTNHNIFQIVQLTAGVTNNGWAVWQQPYQQNAMEKVSIGGGLSAANEYVLDGAPNSIQNQNANLVGSNPPLESVGEFKVQTNTYDAQYGRTSGGVINVTTKSGTNALHGSVYEFARRDAWEANSFQNNAARLPRQSRGIDQYGFQVDGPVWIPKLYNGRNRTFFMFSWEDYRESYPDPRTQSVPEPDMLKGDFSRLANAAGQQITIHDPMTGHMESGRWIRDAFPGNVIPASRINPIAAKILTYMPKPNQRSSTGEYGQNNLFLSGGANERTDRFYNYITRLDHSISDRHRVYARYHDSARHEHQVSNAIYDSPGETGAFQFFQPQSASVDWVGTMSPTFILNARANYNYYEYRQRPKTNEGFDKARLGFPDSLLRNIPGGAFFGQYSFSNYVSLGQYGGGYRNHVFSNEVNATKILGAHTVKAGFDIRTTQFAERWLGCPFCISFNRDFTRRDYQDTREALTGNTIASALLGYPSGVQSQLTSNGFFSRRYVAGYVQDDWKATRRLTLNLGFRYDVYLPFSERYNRLNRGFDTSIVNPVDKLVDRTKFATLPQLKGGLLFAGQNGLGARAADTFFGGVQPRIGLAYQLTPNIVLRGGFGRSYYDIYPDVYTKSGFDTVSTNAIVSEDGSRTPAGNALSNPFPTGLVFGSQVLDSTTYLGRGFGVFQPDLKTPHMHQFSLGLQFALPAHQKLDVAYQGNRGYDLRMNEPINEPNLAMRQACDAMEGGSALYCNQQVANPFAGMDQFRGTNRYNNTISRWELARPYPEFGGLTDNSSNDSRTYYNSLQIVHEIRNWRGLTVSSAYTWSKFMERWGWNDYQNRKYQQGPYWGSVPHSFRVAALYDLPFGPGRRFLTSKNAIVRRLVSGWQYNTIYSVQKGFPMDNNTNLAYLADASVGGVNWKGQNGIVRVFKPCAVVMSNNAGDPLTTASHGAYDQQFGCSASNANWMLLPSYAPQMVASRNGQLTKAPVWNVDMSLNKTTRVTEKVSLQFRAEALNAFNHYTYSRENPRTSPTDPLFGTIVLSAISANNTSLPRDIQLGLKLLW